MQVPVRKLVLGLMCLALVGCGKEPKHEDLPEIMNRLGVKLKIFDDISSGNPYRRGMYIVRGKECSIADLSPYDPATYPPPRRNDLISPDKRVRVTVTTFGRTLSTLSLCVEAAREALGWTVTNDAASRPSRPTTHPHSQTATRHAYPHAFVTQWTAWCAKRVGETWCQCAMRRAQEIYDFKKFNTPQTDWSPFFRACGDQGPGPQPPIGLQG